MLLDDLPLLSLTLFLPLLGAFCVVFIRGDETMMARNAWSVGLLTSCVTFLLSLVLWARFDPSAADYTWQESAQWLVDLGLHYRVGIDGISLPLVVLTTLLVPLALLVSAKNIKEKTRTYVVCFLVLETMMLGSFMALDLFLFYIFFEGVLIPMFLIIGVWGGPRRVYASLKFFLYTLLGSVLMLVAILVIYREVGSTDLLMVEAYRFPLEAQKWLWLAFLASFAVKIPMWGVHTWLPDAHVEAPTAGSVVLAGVMLKMGGYGIVRFLMPLFPEASQYFAPFILTVSAVAVIYTSLVALVQKDMKKLIAYSSVAHMGFVTCGLFTFTIEGVQGAYFQMISHGFVSAALFFCVGVLYDRLHTREIAAYGGVAKVMPLYTTLAMIFVLASVGLPGTTGFVGEVLVLIASFHVSPFLAFFMGLGIILGAAYGLWLFARVWLGPLEKDAVKKLLDLTNTEKTVLIPLAALVIVFGFYPSPILRMSEGALAQILNEYTRAPQTPTPTTSQHAARERTHDLIG
ncbi:MAG: NADH-quinone oxidoreductase subunit M [Proteobacteria bacterium]|nr:NADH-quinone oxidoreductase subunit M [Pseudomonadota bacterium]